MNINISGDQNEMSAPARQALWTTKYTMQRTKRQHPATLSHGLEGLCYSDNEAVVKEMKLEYIFEMHSFSTDLEDESVNRTNHSQQRKILRDGLRSQYLRQATRFAVKTFLGTATPSAVINTGPGLQPRWFRYVDNNCTGQALVCRLITIVNGR